ncbi:hypothetical protein J437_LFUL016992 [Ladona fulva]|uniref:EGF-like domain-containing protein n=1 Tax=Ladona fulva TaxID=123851 RepID=A0A8K0KKV9_LADFU|nr:hypothetical protein J437_LFUL016992 [Ladona fulva]
MYVGEYCQQLNPCRTGPGPRCQNGGTCVVIPFLPASSHLSASPLSSLASSANLLSPSAASQGKGIFSMGPGSSGILPGGPELGAASFRCICPIGFSASLCEIPEPNACDAAPCKNGGSCTLLSLKNYTCTCPPGYTGTCLAPIVSERTTAPRRPAKTAPNALLWRTASNAPVQADSWEPRARRTSTSAGPPSRAKEGSATTRTAPTREYSLMQYFPNGLLPRPRTRPFSFQIWPEALEINL